MFAAERDRLAAALGEVAVRIDHFGSTAVPGLAAKPWIDIQVAVRRMRPADAYRDPLLALGYVHHPDDDDDHEFFDRRPYHVHVCAAGGDWARRHLAFRDLLRRDAAARYRLPGGEAAPGRRARRRPRLHGGQDAGHSPPPGRFYPAAMTSRRRLDAELVERGLAENRSRAQALVMAGRVTVGGRMVDKAGTAVAGDADIAVTERPRYVSRGGDKLETGLRRWHVDVTGERCLDVGASTGGFTDCLLQHGAAEVIALDVGRGQLHERLRSNPSVHVIERMNARVLTAADLPYRPGFVTADVSFISLRLVLPPVVAAAAPEWRAIVLVKPQFEAGRELVKDGVVRDPAVRGQVLHDLCAFVTGSGSAILGVCDSSHPGPAGNREYLLYLASPGHPVSQEREVDVDAEIRDAVHNPG